jgi:hypothetical protein
LVLATGLLLSEYRPKLIAGAAPDPSFFFPFPNNLSNIRWDFEVRQDTKEARLNKPNFSLSTTAPEILGVC